MKIIHRFFTNSPITEFVKGKLLKGVEIFKAGIYRGKKYTKADLQKMVNNFNLLKRKNIFPNVPVRVDHTSSASDLAGYIEKLRIKGKTLVADLDITEDSIYKKIKKTTLRSRSIEIGTYEDNKGNEYFPVVFGVAWVDIPQVEGLAPVFAYSKDTKIINLNNPKSMLPEKNKLNKDDEKEKVEGQENEKEDEEKDETDEKDDKEKLDKEEGDESDEDTDNEDDNEKKEKEEADEEGEGGDEETDDDDDDDDDEDEEEEEEEKDEKDEKSEEEKDDKGEEEKTPDEEVDDLIKEIDEKIEAGEEDAFVDETNLSKKIDNMVKMANKITVGRAKKLIASLQSVAKNLIDSGKYYSASRISELLSSLETILGSDSLSKKIDSTKWNKKFINSLPNSSFAVIEPAYINDEINDKNARHLPYKNTDGKVNLANLRNALIHMDKVISVTDSISDNDLRNKAKAKLTKIAKRYLKTTKYAKTLSEKGAGDVVKLRRKDYNQLIRDAEKADKLQETVEKTVLEKRTTQINAYCKDGKSTPAMAEIEKKFVISLDDAQMELYEQLKSKQPNIVKFDEEQIKQDSKESDGKSTSEKDSDKLASDFIQRTNPKLPESTQEEKKDKKED